MVRYKTYFDSLNRLGMSYKCDRRRDRRSDILLANAALHYVARQKYTGWNWKAAHACIYPPSSLGSILCWPAIQNMTQCRL